MEEVTTPSGDTALRWVSPSWNPNAYDTVALAKVAGKAIIDRGDKDWFFLTADYAFGHSLEKDSSDVVKGNGGMFYLDGKGQ